MQTLTFFQLIRRSQPLSDSSNPFICHYFWVPWLRKWHQQLGACHSSDSKSVCSKNIHIKGLRIRRLTWIVAVWAGGRCLCSTWHPLALCNTMYNLTSCSVSGLVTNWLRKWMLYFFSFHCMCWHDTTNHTDFYCVIIRRLNAQQFYSVFVKELFYSKWHFI